MVKDVYQTTYPDRNSAVAAVSLIPMTGTDFVVFDVIVNNGDPALVALDSIPPYNYWLTESNTIYKIGGLYL